MDPSREGELVIYYKLSEGKGTRVYDSANGDVSRTIISSLSDVELWTYDYDLTICERPFSYNQQMAACICNFL